MVLTKYPPNGKIALWDGSKYGDAEVSLVPAISQIPRENYFTENATSGGAIESSKKGNGGSN